MNKSPYQILIRPIITEKAMMGLAKEANRQYTFQVATTANKIEIRWAVEKAYGVKVVSVNTVRHRGKARQTRMRNSRPGHTATTKKAIVTLAEGQEIALM